MFGLFTKGQGIFIPTRLTSFIVYDTAGNPLVGNIRADWTYIGSVSGAEIEIYYDFGSGYVLLEGAIDPTLLTRNLTVGDQPGFTSLDNTDFRINLKIAGVDVLDSPQFEVPPYDGPP